VPEAAHQVFRRGARRRGEGLARVPQVMEVEARHSRPAAGTAERLPPPGKDIALAEAGARAVVIELARITDALRDNPIAALPN